MEVKYGEGKTEYGPGVLIELDGEEVATAIEAWLVAHGVVVRGPRTVCVNGELCREGSVYVDPSGFVVFEGKRYSGKGEGGDYSDFAENVDLKLELSKKNTEIDILRIENAENAVMYRNTRRELLEMREQLRKWVGE